jgi:hypothetical protein
LEGEGIRGGQGKADADDKQAAILAVPYSVLRRD